MKNLVMGFATNVEENSVRVFCTSARRVYGEAECDIVIITNKYEPYFLELNEIGVTFFETPNNYSRQTGLPSKILNRAILNSLRAINRFPMLANTVPEISASYRTLLETWHHPHFARWFGYHRFLALNRQYDQVLLADVKDVVFQSHFFSASDNAVSLFDQDVIYGESNWDTEWYREAWGEVELKKVLGKSAVCIGTILGPNQHVLSLVGQLCEYILRFPFGRIEQAVFNYMLQNELIEAPHQIVPNLETIGTLADDNVHARTITEDGLIKRAADKSVIPVVHMYDRFADTMAAYQ
jgi:hypothetical protein